MDATVVVIGAGQAGLAMSRCLTDQSIDHVLLERGSVANSWRTERWDSLRLLTPNWLTRLPGTNYTGSDPDGFMTATEVAAFLDGYRQSIAAPVVAGAEVTAVSVVPNGFKVTTSLGAWRCRAVVIASGAASRPLIPALAETLPGWIHQLSPVEYRNPAALELGPVLVVGASASGVQIADELQRSGRQVTLSVGDHVRVPRQCRGRDIQWWMDAIGLLNERITDVDDQERARRLPSLQLIGSSERRDLDLNSLTKLGVVLVGRLVGLRDTHAQCSGSLANLVKSADLKQSRLLDRIDEFAATHEMDGTIGPTTRPEPTSLRAASNNLDLRSFRTIVWATGHRPTWPWLDPVLANRVLDKTGWIRHDQGVVDAPGMYILGLPFLRRRSSSFIDGVGADALELTAHLGHYLDRFAVRSGSRAITW